MYCYYLFIMAYLYTSKDEKHSCRMLKFDINDILKLRRMITRKKSSNITMFVHKHNYDIHLFNFIIQLLQRIPKVIIEIICTYASKSYYYNIQNNNNDEYNIDIRAEGSHRTFS